MNSNQQGGNRLLAALAEEDCALLGPHLRDLPLVQGLVLQEQETPVEQVYFPLSGVISLVSVMKAGEAVETAMIGREGTVGALGGLGPWNAFSRAVVDLPGMALAIPVARFQAAVAKSDRIRSLVLRYKEALLAQVQQTAACNALHHHEERFARWLLQALDRCDDPKLPLTQDFIANKLAARRSTITDIAGKLQHAGLISYHRGHITVVDRVKLEDAACECYRTVRRRTEAVFRAAQGQSGVLSEPSS
jgi:CRP-like cAMP-binding protein